jgi:hypothetical protein
LGTYQDLVDAQGATSYWALDTARADTATESDLIGTVDLTMSGGASTAATAPPMETVTAGVSLTIAGTEGYDAANSYDPDADMSFSGWFKMPTQASATEHILFTLCQTNTSTDYVYLIRRDDQSNDLVLQFGSGGGAVYLTSGIEPENDGKWHHVAVTRDYSATDTLDTWTIYVDGKQVAQSTRSAIGHSSNFTADNWTIGNRAALDDGMDGDLAAWAFAEAVLWTADQVWMQYAHGMSNYPTTVPTPEFWVDADDAQTITDTTGNVTAWDDKSPNSRHLDNVRGTPRTGDTTENSRNVIDFDGTEDLYDTADFMWDLVGHTALVAGSTSASTDQVAVGEGNSTDTNPNLLAIRVESSTGELRSTARDDSATSEYQTDSNDAVNDGAMRIMLTVDNGSTEVWHRLDGAPTTSHNKSSPLAYTRDLTLTLNRFSVGAYERGSAVLPWNGSIGDVLVFDGVLSDANITAVEGWLDTRWVPPPPSPSGPPFHPYRRMKHLLVR